MPKVSVIINCYNGEKYLREAIDSVYCQTFQDWEIILWDDDSTDNSANIAKSYDQRLRYFKGEKAASLGQARNFAIERARGEFIAILDQDDVWLPHKLEMQIPLFERNPSVGLVFSDAIDFYEDSKKRISHFLNLNIKPPRGQIFDYLFVIENYPISMPTAVFRTKALFSLKELFDIRYKYAEEYDLFLRISHDWECDYVDEPLAIYRIHNVNSTKVFHKAIPIELKSIMDKILNYYPELKQRLKNEILRNERTIDLQYAKSLFQEGRRREGRIILRKHLSHYKCFFTFLGSFLPHQYAMDLRNLFYKFTRYFF